jgi:hypothetical protein
MFLETEKPNLIGNKLYPKTGFELNEGSNFYEWNTKSLGSLMHCNFKRVQQVL